MRSRLAVPALLALTAVVPDATATEASFIIVNPAGRGNQSMAQGFLTDFSRAVRASWPADAGTPPEWTGQYHVHQADALASIRKKRPIFGVLSPGFFLELRDDLELEPLLLPRQPEDAAPVVHAVVVEGSPASGLVASGSVEALAVGGRLAGEPAWARRVLLGALQGHEVVELIPQARTLQAVRALRKGAVDVLLLSDREWHRLDAVAMRGGLAVAHSTASLPEGPVATIGRPTGEPDDPESRARRRALAEAAARALAAFPETEAGRAVLDKMGLTGFEPVPEGVYDRVARLHAGDPASASEDAPP